MHFPILILLLGSVVAAPAIAGPPLARLVQLVRTDALPADVPGEVRPMMASGPGVSATFLVTSERLSEFKEGSLRIDGISAGPGTTLPPNIGQRAEFNAFFAAASTDGTYGRFTVHVPLDGAIKVEGLKLRGSVRVFLGGSAESTKPVPAPLQPGTEAKAGAFTIKAATQQPGLLLLGPGKGGLSFTVEGPPDSIRGVVALVEGKPLESAGIITANGVKTYGFAPSPDQNVEIRIDYWQNRTEVVVPFAIGD